MRLVQIAKLAFVSQAPDLIWSEGQEDFIVDSAFGVLSIGEYEWFDVCAEAQRSFATAVYGGLMALYASGSIDHTDYMLGEAHLAGYIFAHSEELCSLYNDSMNRAGDIAGT